MHGVSLLERDEVHAGGEHGQTVGLYTKVEEKPQDVDILGQVIPRLAGGEGLSQDHLAFLSVGKAGVQGILVELGQLLQRNSSWDGWRGRSGVYLGLRRVSW